MKPAAQQEGTIENMIGKLLKETGDYTEDGLNAALDKVISARHADMKEVNLKAIRLGAEL